MGWLNRDNKGHEFFSDARVCRKISVNYGYGVNTDDMGLEITFRS